MSILAVGLSAVVCMSSAGSLAATAAAATPAKVKVEVSAAANFSCAVAASQRVQCWGDVVNGQQNVPAGHYSYVSAGYSGYACAITTSKHLKCWGGGPDGLPTGILKPPAGTFTALSTGASFACAVSTAKALKCWGNDPQVVGQELAGKFTAVAAGTISACAIDTKGLMYCWGNSDGAVNPPSGGFKAVSASGTSPGASGYACGLRAGGAVNCWGHGPTSVLARHVARLSSVSVFDVNGCGISSGRVVCWGDNTQGQLDPPSGKYTEVSAGAEYACAVTVTSLVRCWGQPGFNDLGAPPVTPAPAPPGGAVQGRSYSYAIPSSPGYPAGTFTVSHGALPPGLRLSGSGALSGSPTAPGSFTFTVTVVNLEGSKSAAFTIDVASTLIGFVTPRNGAVDGSHHPLKVGFRLGSYQGALLGRTSARRLQTKVTVSANANGKAPVSSALCTYSAAKHEFTCQLARPAKVHTGKAHPYYLTVYERLGAKYVTVPLTKALTSGNPEVIYYR